MAPRFEPFGTAHLGALAAIAAGAVVLAALARRDPHGPLGRALRGGLAVGQLALVAISAATVVATGDPSWREALPLHLCDVALFVGTVALVTRAQLAYELLYFWGMAGTVLALLTPDLGAGFPEWSFVAYFTLHGTVVIAAVVLTVGYGMRPAPGAVRRAFLATNAYAAFVAIVNLALGTNFLYLCRKPGAATPLDWLGPWPWYVVAAEGVALALFTLVDLPFRRARRRAAAAAG